MTEYRNRVWWWLGIAIVVNAVILIGMAIGDPVAALMVVAGIAPVAAALHHFIRLRRRSRAR
jgi:hypothetical protein